MAAQPDLYLPPPKDWDDTLAPASGHPEADGQREPTEQAHTCVSCGLPVDLAEPHITLASHVEQERDGDVTVLDAEVVSYRHQTCRPNTTEPESTDAEQDQDGGEAPEPVFPSLEAWVAGYLIHHVTVDLGAGMYWCSQWWRHTEALSRLEGIWREWETHRLPDGAGMSVWWRDHADHQLNALMESSRSPFRQCTPTEHRDHLQPLPVEPAPPGWFGA